MGPKRNRFDPRLVLEEIASDRNASPTARVAAAKALLNLDATPEDDVVDGLTRRAMAKMRARHD
jgi:MoxR-like ATPase